VQGRSVVRCKVQIHLPFASLLIPLLKAQSVSVDCSWSVEVDHRGLAGYLHDPVYSVALSLPGSLISAVTGLHHIGTVQLSPSFVLLLKVKLWCIYVKYITSFPR
jgi:hypothetical protein